MDTNYKGKLRKVAVLGSNGMLGRSIASQLFQGFEVLELNRAGKPVYTKNRYLHINSLLTNESSTEDFSQVDFMVNCVGLIRQKINVTDPRSVHSAIQANSEIPIKLMELSEKFGFKIIQIGTDCVYSGREGKYLESDPHDALDVYGKSKSLGEISHKNICILRSSIIGLEVDSAYSLLSWFLSQEYGSTIKGFNDQRWNGVTVLHFAKIVVGIIENDLFEIFSGVHHLLPANQVTKSALLENFASAFKRKDLKIESVASGRNLNMTLGTLFPELNQQLWNLAGYSKLPTIEEMILEYSSNTRLEGRK